MLPLLQGADCYFREREFRNAHAFVLEGADFTQRLILSKGSLYVSEYRRARIVTRKTAGGEGSTSFRPAGARIVTFDCDLMLHINIKLPLSQGRGLLHIAKSLNSGNQPVVFHAPGADCYLSKPA